MTRIYWGDLHSHCEISYGTGSLEHALRAAAGHLDFAAITGHANWPDMPSDRQRYSTVIDYHRDGFARLERHWDAIRAHVERHHRPGVFVPILSTEWHSIAVGDHNVYFPTTDGAIPTGDDLDSLHASAPPGALLVPHHIGYGPGARGIDWDAFDATRSPVVEVVSTHGASDEGSGSIPSFHTMGPFHAQGSLDEGLRRGHRFGVIGGTDHHAGYPGHHGGGRTAVLADALTREELFAALRARRCYAATGDAIELAFEVDGTPMGAEGVSVGPRSIAARARGADAIASLEVLRNGQLIASARSDDRVADTALRRRWKVRLEWGWGEKGVRVDWLGAARVRAGRLVAAEPVFRGEEVIDPRDAQRRDASDEPDHAVLAIDDASVSWRSVTYGNPHPRVPSTAGLVLEIDGDARTSVELTVNDLTVEYPIDTLARGAVAHRLRGWLSEALLVHRAVPDVCFTASIELRDDGELDTDVYRVRVLQANGQRAWSSPIWIERR